MTDTSGTCDWCKKHADELKPRRDFEEGMNGRLYDVCQACIDKENKRLNEDDNY